MKLGDDFPEASRYLSPNRVILGTARTGIADVREGAGHLDRVEVDRTEHSPSCERTSILPALNLRQSWGR
jgi:hypothetical protein